MRKFFLGIFFLVSLLGMNGCAMWYQLIGQGPQKPEIQLQSMTIEKFSLDKILATFTLSVSNPNGFAIDFAHLQYSLKLKDKLLAEGAHTSGFKIDANKTEMVDLPLEINTQELVGIILKSFDPRNNQEILLQAEAKVHTGFGYSNFKYESTKKLVDVIKKK